MSAPESYIPIPDLVVGHVYRLRCRNLTFGAYDGKQFVGIREKFGRLYLDSEDHWDTGEPYGTAYPIEDMGPLPEGMSPKESFGSVCKVTGRPIVWDEAQENTRVPGHRIREQHRPLRLHAHARHPRTGASEG